MRQICFRSLIVGMVTGMLLTCPLAGVTDGMEAANTHAPVEATADLTAEDLAR